LIDNMTEKERKLGKRILEMQEEAHRKNIALDAMWWVWCDGGCSCGTARYSDKELTEEVVQTAEHNVKRLRTWFNNKQFRNKWKTMSESEREAWMLNARGNGQTNASI